MWAIGDTAALGSLQEELGGETGPGAWASRDDLALILVPPLFVKQWVRKEVVSQPNLQESSTATQNVPVQKAWTESEETWSHLKATRQNDVQWAKYLKSGETFRI